MAEKIKISKKGLEELQAKYENLINVEQPQAEEALNFARSQGDLSENADYDAAREKFENIKAEIAKLKHIFDNYELVEEDSTGVATARLGGGEITVKNLTTGKEYTFVIVGSVEADPLHQKISNTCPVAQAIINHKVGDTVTVDVAKPYQLEILNIA